MTQLYDMIYKRKSMRRFDSDLHLTQEELRDAAEALERCKPLIADIGTGFRVVKREETSCKIGEYCLLAYSQQKPGDLLNMGYLLEQWDLYLSSRNIGACWYGFGKTKLASLDGQRFVIMIAFGKSREADFRKDLSKVKRKDPSVIWQGDCALDVMAAARYAPSACNSQPWRVSAYPDRLEVYRTPVVTDILARGLTNYFNWIDMGIFLCFLELALEQSGYAFMRTLAGEQAGPGPIPVATYTFLFT